MGGGRGRERDPTHSLSGSGQKPLSRQLSSSHSSVTLLCPSTPASLPPLSLQTWAPAVPCKEMRDIPPKRKGGRKRREEKIHKDGVGGKHGGRKERKNITWVWGKGAPIWTEGERDHTGIYSNRIFNYKKLAAAGQAHSISLLPASSLFPSSEKVRSIAHSVQQPHSEVLGGTAKDMLGWQPLAPQRTLSPEKGRASWELPTAFPEPKVQVQGQHQHQTPPQPQGESRQRGRGWPT